MEMFCSLLVTSVLRGEAATAFHTGDLVIYYSSLARKMYLKCCQQQDPAEFLLLCQITIYSEEILDVRPSLGISCVTSEEGCGGRSISSMVHGHKLLNILLSVVMILVMCGKKAAFILKPEEFCMYWCL